MIDMPTRPNYYLITPDFESDESTYLSNLEKSLNNGVKLVQLRSKNLSAVKYQALAENVIPLVKAHQGKVILNKPVNLLSHCDADGIHLPSHAYATLTTRPIDDRYLLSVACHNPEQLALAEKIGADLAVLCPVFSTPSSPNGIPIGWQNFSQWVKAITLPIYALGGLTCTDYSDAIQHGASGIAAKRALWGLTEKLPTPPDPVLCQ